MHLRYFATELDEALFDHVQALDDHRADTHVFSASRYHSCLELQYFLIHGPFSFCHFKLLSFELGPSLHRFPFLYKPGCLLVHDVLDHQSLVRAVQKEGEVRAEVHEFYYAG